MKEQNRDDQDDSLRPEDLGLTFTGDEDPEVREAAEKLFKLAVEQVKHESRRRELERN